MSRRIGFVVSTELFRDVLAKAQGAVSAKDVDPTLKCFRFELKGNDLVVTTTNFIFSEVIRCTVEGKDDGVAVIPAITLSKIAADADGSLVRILVDDNRAEVKSGYATWNIQCPVPETFPNVLAIDESAESVLVSRKQLGQALLRARPFISKQESMIRFSQVRIRDGNALSSDSTVAARIGLGDFKADLALPGSSVEELTKVLSVHQEETVRVQQRNNHIILGIGSNVFISTSVQTPFGDVNKTLFDVAKTNTVKVNFSAFELSGALRRCGHVSNNDIVELFLEPGVDRMVVHAESSEGHSATEQVKYDADGLSEKYSIFLLVTHLTEIIKAIGKEVITVRFGKPNKQGKKPPVLIQNTNEFGQEELYVAAAFSPIWAPLAGGSFEAPAPSAPAEVAGQVSA